MPPVFGPAAGNHAGILPGIGREAAAWRGRSAWRVHGFGAALTFATAGARIRSTVP